MFWLRNRDVRSREKRDPSIGTREQVDTEFPAEKDVLLKAISEFRIAADKANVQCKFLYATANSRSKRLIEQARSWVKDSGVSWAACSIYDETRLWAAWATNPDWPVDFNTLDVSDLSHDNSISKTSVVAFSRRGHRWQFALVKSDGYAEADFFSATLTVTFDGQDVLELLLHQGFDQYDKWRPVDVRGLVIGPWAAELVEMDGVNNHVKERRRSQKEADRIKTLAAKMRLDGAG